MPVQTNSVRRRLTVVAPAVAGVVGLGGFSLGAAILGGPRHDYACWQELYLAGCAGYLSLLVYLRRCGATPAVLLVAAMLVRVPFLWTEPDKDAYRYVWEGRMQWLGVNPFGVAPDDPSLAPYRDAIWQHIDKKHYTTIYPPLSQAVFAVVARLWYDVKAIQLAAMLFDVAVVGLLVDTLRRLRRPAWYAAIYAFCPLVLSSFAQAGHFDVVMLAALLLFARYLVTSRHAAAGLSLGLAVLAKTVPAILAVVLLRRDRRAVVLAGIVVVVGYLPYVGAGRGLFFALLDFPNQDRFNNFFDGLARILITDATGFQIPLHSRNALALLVLAGAAIGMLVRRGRPEEDCRFLLAGVLVLLPIIHYWYLTWVLLFVALRPSGAFKWLVLSITLVLYWNVPQSYAAGLGWHLRPWELWTIWAPFFITGCIEAWQRRNRSGARRPIGQV